MAKKKSALTDFTTNT